MQKQNPSRGEKYLEGRGYTETQRTGKKDVSNSRNSKSKYYEMLHYLKVAYLQIPVEAPKESCW